MKRLGVLFVLAVVVAGCGGSSPATVSVTTKSFPAPLAGAVVFSRELGQDAVGLAVKPQAGALLVQASVLGRQGEGVKDLSVSFSADHSSETAKPCGDGCYRAQVSAPAKPRAVTVEIGATRWRVALPTTWPAPDATRLIARAERVWRSLDSLTFRERLASGTGQAVESSWRAQAPDRIAYHVDGGYSAVIVGGSRWDRPPGANRWRKSPQTSVTQPVPTWVSVTNAHVLGTTTVGGHPAWRVSFFDPGTPGWFTLLIDKRTYRTLEVDMIATAHFMRDSYGDFNSAEPIVPPVSGS